MSLRGSDLIKDLIEQMRTALEIVFGSQWNEVKDYVEDEIGEIATSVLKIRKLRGRREITEEQARSLLEMQLDKTRYALLSIEAAEGLQLSSVEEAIKTVKSIIAKQDFEALMEFDEGGSQDH